MIFGVILMILTIMLTLYIVFSAAKCQKVFINNVYNQSDNYHNQFTRCLSKMTIIVSIMWWGTLLLTKLMIKYFTDFDPIWKIEATLFIFIAIILILGILFYRNYIYKKYLKDNIVNVMLIEYTLSFVLGTLYAFILTYALQSALIIF